MDSTTLADAIRADKAKKAKEIIDSRVEDSLRIFEQILSTNMSMCAADAHADKLRFEAAKHTLKLAGLERENVELSGQVTFLPVKISREVGE